MAEDFINTMLIAIVLLPVPMLIWAKAYLANQALSARIRRIETNIRVASGRKGGR